MNLRVAALATAYLCFVAFGGIVSASTARAQTAAADPLSRDRILRDPDLPVLGNPNGDITIVAYFDYQCPYCKKVDPELVRVVREDGNVRLVFKDWPLFGDASTYAARLVLAAKYQNKYREAHEAVIAAREKLTEASVQDILARAGVDVKRAVQDLSTNKKTLDALLARNHDQAVALGFRGTPAFIVGHFRLPGAVDASTFKQVITDARAAQNKK